jgi:cell wall-associated NlpC family hydrolase
MGNEHKSQERQSSQLKQAAGQEGQGKSMTPPPFQLKADSSPAQLKQDGAQGDVTQQMSLGDVVSGVSNWVTNLFNPQAAEESESAGAESENMCMLPENEGGTSELQQEQVAEVTTAEPEAEPEQTREERISELLQAHYDGFALINVNIPNPVPTEGEPTVACEVRPPYMINSGDRITNAQTARAANRRVNTLINTYPWGFRHGKASASQIQTFLQAAIDQGLTTNNTSVGLRDFLSLYGIGVDCSGLTSQGYNALLTELGLTEEAQFDVNNTGSGSFRDAHDRFTAVSAPSDLRPGDALYLDNPRGIDHVRMVQNVTVNGDNIDFVTIESAGGTVNGPRQHHWRFTDATDFDSLQVSSDGGTTYVDSTENQEFARFDALYPAEEETENE